MIWTIKFGTSYYPPPRRCLKRMNRTEMEKSFWSILNSSSRHLSHSSKTGAGESFQNYFSMRCSLLSGHEVSPVTDVPLIVSVAPAFTADCSALKRLDREAFFASTSRNLYRALSHAPTPHPRTSPLPNRYRSVAPPAATIS